VVSSGIDGISDPQVRGGEARQALAATLFASPFSLAVGAAAGSAGGITAALLSSDAAIGIVGFALPIVAVLRVLHAVYVRRTSTSASLGPTSEAIYEGGAWLFSLLLGLLAYLVLSRSELPGLHLLVSCLAIGYAAGICARNAGRPRVALGQLALAALPISPALMASDDPAKWVLAIVNVFFVLGLADITRKTHAIFQSAVAVARACEEEYRNAISHLPVMSWTASSSGETTYQSRQWTAFTGTMEVCSGNTQVGLVHPADWTELNAAWSRAVRTGCDFRAQYRLLHRSGKYRWVLSIGEPEKDENGRILRWHGACVDIHDALPEQDEQGFFAKRA
jgi:PAS domain S-box-containing protein